MLRFNIRTRGNCDRAWPMAQIFYKVHATRTMPNNTQGSPAPNYQETSPCIYIFTSGENWTPFIFACQ